MRVNMWVHTLVILNGTLPKVTHAPFSHCIRKAFYLPNLPSAVGISWGQLHHQCWPKSYEHWDCYLGKFGYGWGRQGKAGNNNNIITDALSNLVQQDSPEPGVAVVKVLTNLPHLPQGSFGFPYLDITTLSKGASTTQFPLTLLHLLRLLPYSHMQVILPWKKEGDGLKIYPFLV